MLEGSVERLNKIRDYLGEWLPFLKRTGTMLDKLRFPSAPTLENAQRAMDRGGVCFHCGEAKWFGGPQGGAAMNIMCGVCGQRLNIIFGTTIVVEVQNPFMVARTDYDLRPQDKSPRTARFHYWYEDERGKAI
jgi:hypothetical protein